MSNGSTDISVIENEVVYVHFSYQGDMKCSFLDLIACESRNATGLYDAIMKTLPNIAKESCGLHSDGASANTGHLNGVIALFHNIVSRSILMVKCMSHRVELAFK